MGALVLLLFVPVVMWGTQSVLLWRVGKPLRWRISAGDLPRELKRINRIMTNLTFAVVLLGYPLLRGASPWVYYGRFLPLGQRPGEALVGAAAAVLYLGLLYLAWTLTDNTRFEVRHKRSKLVRRLAAVPLAAVMVAFVEELLFRAMLLAALLEDFAAPLALTIGVLVFAGAHYVRSVKRYWTFPGHVALGLLFCVAFYCTDALWLPMGLHAGGVVVLLGARPFVRYTGPPWLVGASIFPYGGAVGIAALLLLTVNLWLRYGGPA